MPRNQLNGRYQGRDFSNDNLRGKNLSNYDLTEANFVGAHCGVSHYWTVLMCIISLILGATSGFATSILFNHWFYFYTNQYKKIYTYCISLIYIISVRFLIIKFIAPLLRQDLRPYLVDFLIILAIFVIALVGIFVPKVMTVSQYSNKNEQKDIERIFLISIIVCLSDISLFLGSDFIRTALSLPKTLFGTDISSLIRAIVAGFLGIIIGDNISEKALLNKNKKFVWIWDVFIYFLSIGGTNFSNSNLDSVNFSGLNLRGSQLINNSLKRTNFSAVKQIESCRIIGSYLEDPKIRNLVTLKIKKERQEDDFSKMNLQGLYLQGFELNDTDFSDADLSDSDLQSSHLNKATLVNTKLDNAELQNAIMTGVIIDKGSISHTTNLTGIVCKYIYLPSNLNEPCPSSKNQSSEQAIKWLQKPLEIDLIFSKEGIDWKAFLIAFDNTLINLSIEPNYSQEPIQAFESKPDGSFIIRLNVPDNVTQRDFENTLKQDYARQLSVLKRKYGARLRPEDIENNQRNNINLFYMVRKLSISGGTNTISGAGALSLGDLSGIVSNSISNLPDEPGIKELLIRLQELIEADSNFLEDEKKQLLEEVNTFTEFLTNSLVE